MGFLPGDINTINSQTFIGHYGANATGLELGDCTAYSLSLEGIAKQSEMAQRTRGHLLSCGIYVTLEPTLWSSIHIEALILTAAGVPVQEKDMSLSPYALVSSAHTVRWEG